MRRYLDSSTPAVSSRYGLALVPTARPATEVPLAPEQCLALATYQYPTSRIHCCPVPAPIAPSDATEFVWGRESRHEFLDQIDAQAAENAAKVEAWGNMAERKPKPGDLLWAPDGHAWLCCCALHRAVEDAVLLVCFRNGARKTWRQEACRWING